MTRVEYSALITIISTETNMFGTASNAKMKMRRQQGASALNITVNCNAQTSKLEI
jgi:hypothetical protein